MLAEAERVEAIPNKPPAAVTRYLSVTRSIACSSPCLRKGALALRDQALLMLLYNTGARVQEVVELRVGECGS